MPLGKWHGTRIEPAVNYLWHTMHFLAAVRTLNGNIINIWTMKLNIIWAVIRHGLQLLNGTDGMLTATGALPNIKWSSPITVTANTPILKVLQPLTKTTGTDSIRHPVNGLVVGDELFLHVSHLDEPRISCIVDER